MAAVATLTPQGYFSDLTHMSVSSPSTRTTMSIETSSTSPTRTTSLYSPNFGFRLQYDHPDSDREDDIIPKVEELDEDEDIEAKLALIPESTTETFGEPLVSPTTVKRPRGRPRKHPISPPTSVAKITKGRSKTGCLTCRRRKKKCDETKPHCLNCQKNAVVCEGYPERQLWKSGKQKAQEARRYSSGGPSSSLPCLIDGVETDIDRRFLDHFVHDVSRILTLFADDSNPFKEILLPMAMRHRGLMHSLLCLAGSHLASRENTPVYNERQMYHFDRAVSNLRTDRKIEAHISGSDDAPIDDPSVAQTLIFALQTICEGKTNGEYRPHMDATRHLVMTQKTQNSAFGQFLYEFFTYHDVSNAITSLDRRPLMMTEDFVLPQFIVQPEAGAMLGVLDGLFAFISKITNLRDKIRKRRTGLMEPQVDYETLSEAVAIDNAIHTWVPPQQEGTIRYIASQLYRQATWVYLYRTIQPSAPSSKIREAVDQGLAYLRMLPSEGSTQSILLMPLFLLGCAAFEDDQRPDISDAFVGLKEYSQLGNIVPAREIVERVWSMMDAGDDRSWDWETIIKEMGYDFLVT